MSWETALGVIADLGTVVALVTLAWQVWSKRQDDQRENRQRWYERLMAVNQLAVTVDAVIGTGDGPRGTARVENTTPFVVRDLRLHIWPERFGDEFPDELDEAVVTRSLAYLEVGETKIWEFGDGSEAPGSGEGVRWWLRFVDHTGSTWRRDVGQIPRALSGPAAEIDPPR